MKCEDFLPLLPMVPDELPDGQTNAFFKHTAECAPCCLEWERHQVMLSMLRSIDDYLEVPEDLHERWTAAVYSRERKKKGKNHLYYRVIGLAATIIVIFGTILMREGVIFYHIEDVNIEPAAVTEPMLITEPVAGIGPDMSIDSMEGGESLAAADSNTGFESGMAARQVMQSQNERYGLPSDGMLSGDSSEAEDFSDSDSEVLIEISEAASDSMSVTIGPSETVENNSDRTYGGGIYVAGVFEALGKPFSEPSYDMAAEKMEAEEIDSDSVLPVQVSNQETVQPTPLFTRVFEAFLASLRAVPGFLADLLVFLGYIAPYAACAAIAALLIRLIQKIKNKNRECKK